MSEKQVNQIIGKVFNQLADTLISGEYGQKPKVLITATGSEHGEENIFRAALNANRNGVDTTVIATKEAENVKTVLVNSEDEAHKVMEKLLNSNEVDAAVT